MTSQRHTPSRPSQLAHPPQGSGPPRGFPSAPSPFASEAGEPGQRSATPPVPGPSTSGCPGRTTSGTSTRQAANRVDDAELLRAARECVLDNGVRRSTLTEIARRAGVSRMTLYRRFPDVRSVVTGLMTAEFSCVLQQAQATEGSGTARQRLTTALVTAVRLLQSNSLLLRVLETDAELVLPYVVQRLGGTQLAAERFLRDYLVLGHREGSIRAGDPAAQARVLLMIAQSFVLSAKPVRTHVDEYSLHEELMIHLDAALRPTDVRTSRDPEETR